MYIHKNALSGEDMETKKEFETVRETAERLGVTVRAVQKWAATGKIQGAEKIGRTWFIPKGISADTVKGEGNAENAVNAEKAENEIPDVYRITSFRVALPLLNSTYPVGGCMEYIQTIKDEDDRKIALGEYYYFSGRAKEATRTVEEYLDSHDPSLRYSAALICTFSNLSLGHIHLARFAMNILQTQVRAGLASQATVQPHAIGIFTATAASVLLHLPIPEIPPLEDYLRYLPAGLKLYGCYVLAHQAYLEKKYERCLAIADMGIALCPSNYPIASVYVHIAAVMALINLKRTSEAAERMDTAWKLAQADDIIEPFAEHHGLLQGMLEVYFKKNYPRDFERIIAITYSFSAGWRKIHNPDTKHDVADNLTTTEFTIAMLYNRGWLAKEIAGHMNISENTVRKHLKSVFMKLNINDKLELGKYMLN